MGRIWAVALHTVREAVRMKIVVAFACLIFVLVFALPFGIKRPDSTISSMVQMFLTWSLLPLGLILSILAIFLGCLSISEEMQHKQILLLMSKPLPRWQYMIGKWLGVVSVLTGLLLFAGISIYGMTMYLATRENPDDYDRARLTHEVLTARANSPLVVPDFTAAAEARFRLLKEQGRFSDSTLQNDVTIKRKIAGELTQLWRTVPTGQIRPFRFEDIMVTDRSRNNWLQLRYKAKGLGYSGDEVLQMRWVFGDPRFVDLHVEDRRDVKDRYHVVPFPASAISPDGSLAVRVQNLDHLRKSGHHGATIAFEAREGFEVLYKIGSFEGNFGRTLFLIWCRIVLLASVSVCGAALVSYPVACLISFCFYILSICSKFVISGLDFGAPGKGVLGQAHFVVSPVLKALFWIWPKFSEYDGVETFVEGRNVTLMWNIQAFGNLVLLLTTVFLLAACIIFRRRQVAELSI